MNVLIVSANRTELPLPVLPFGACLVAEAAERAGHRVEVLDLMFERSPLAAVASAVARTRPDVVGLSVRNIDNNDMHAPVSYVQDVRALVETIRKATQAPVVLGGAALAVMPEAMLRLADADCGILGDGEAVFPRLLDRLAAGQPYKDLPGLVWRDAGVYRRNSPVAAGGPRFCSGPDYSRWVNVHRYRVQMATVPVQTKRGCPFHCVYCTYGKIEGTTCRFAAPGDVADVVGRYAAAGFSDIEFVDSVFNAPYDHARAVCEALARTHHGARLQTMEMNPLCFDDPLLTAMEKAGFVGIGVTVESASNPVLGWLRKGYTAREVQRAAEVVARHRLPCTWILLFGGPGETAATVQETLRFAKSAIRPYDVVYWNAGIRIYPGTELEDIARRQGVLSVPPEEMLEPVFYVSPDVDAAWMEREILEVANRHMNFVSNASFGLSFLPTIERFAHGVGVRPPLWRYTRAIRRGLRFVGVATA